MTINDNEFIDVLIGLTQGRENKSTLDSQTIGEWLGIILSLDNGHNYSLIRVFQTLLDSLIEGQADEKHEIDVRIDEAKKNHSRPSNLPS